VRATPKPKAPRTGRPTGRFTQHRRLDKLRDVLEAHPTGLDIESLGTLLRITTRSVRRYLRELDRQIELESVATRPGGAHLWRIKPSERGRAVTLRRTQAYGLLAARRIFDVLRGSALFDELDVVMRQLVQIAQRPTRAGVKGEVPSDKRLAERFVFAPTVPRSYTAKGEELDDVFQAVAHSRVLRFRYDPPGTDLKSERVKAEPYALLLHKGELVCVGRDLGADQVRVFEVEAMAETGSVDGETFVLPEDFDISDYLHSDFGLGTGPKTRIVVEFDARIADDVRARKLHPSQKIATSPDGRIRLSVIATDLDSVLTWVLGFGAAARVIEPPELAAAAVATLRAALARYSANG
jgi:predicted DNA-binding transcriptional regulator YafY